MCETLWCCPLLQNKIHTCYTAYKTPPAFVWPSTTTGHFNYSNLLLVPRCLRAFEQAITVSPEHFHPIPSLPVSIQLPASNPMLRLQTSLLHHLLIHIILLPDCLSALPAQKLPEGRSFVVFFSIVSPGAAQCQHTFSS